MKNWSLKTVAMTALVAFVAVFISAISVSAQGTSGKLSGTVSGPDGLLPGAKVVVIDNATSKEVTVVTNDAGFYQVPQLAFGTYTIKITAPGFKTLVGNEQKIDVGRDATFNATLEIGEMSAEVIITAGADVITSGTAQVSNTISPQQIMSLPMITRSPLALTLLQAGTSSNGLTTINGMRTTMTNITRDGINIQDTFIRANATDFAPGRPSVDDTAEFTITTTNQEADQGSGSAQIRLTTPRGTKDLHGALFAYNRNSGFAANNFFNNRSSTAATALKPSFRNRWQYGGKVSGPLWLPAFGEGGPRLWKDKAVFFFNYEGIKDPVSGAATRTIFTPSTQAGGFTWQRTNGTDVTPFCASQTVGSNCTIPSILAYGVSRGLPVPATIDPIIQSRILSQLPTTSNFTGGDGRNTAGYRLLRRSDQTRDQISSRVDVDINDANSLEFIYNYNKEVNLRPDIDTTGFSVVPEGEQFSDNKQYTAAYRRVFSPNVVNEIRGGLFKTEVPFDATNNSPAYHLAIPLISSPENTFMDQGRFTEAWNLQSNGDWIRGSHSFKFGGQLQYNKVDAYNDAGIIPTVTVGFGTGTPQLLPGDFSGIGGISAGQLNTANSLLSLFSGVVTSSTQSFNILDLSKGYEAIRANEPIRHQAHSLYFADRWQVNSQLTLSLGVRWEYYPSMTLETGVALEPSILDNDDPLPSLLRQDGTYVPVGAQAGKKNAYYKTQYDNFAPNFGFAWAPAFKSGLGKFLFGDRSVVRGGYSHAFGNDSIITSIRNASLGNVGLARTPNTIPNQNGRLSGSFALPGVPVFTPPPRSYLQNNGSAQNFFGTVFAIDPNIEVTRVKQYSLGVQREFFGNTAFEVRYVGTNSNNMVRSVDYNQIDVRSNGFAADFIRAQNNCRLQAASIAATGLNCTSAAYNPGIVGSVQLPVFNLLGGNAFLADPTILGQLRAGTPADLALIYIQNNLNNHPTVALPNRVPFVKFLPNPASGVVNLLQNDAYYQYHSLQAEVRRRFSQGLYFQANYTFSKNIGNSTASNGSQTLVEAYLDNEQKNLDRTRVDFDQTHVFNFNGVYQLPFGQGRTFLNRGGVVDKILGGWELSGIVQWNSGVPITFVDPRGTLNRAGRAGRQTANSSLTDVQIRDLLGIYEQGGAIYWINPSIICSNGAATQGYGSSLPCPQQVFFNVEPGQTGKMGRAILNAPSFFNIDASLIKNIRFTENARLQLRLEAYNVLNKVNFFPGAAIQNINSASFGQITSAAASRQLQLAARIEF